MKIYTLALVAATLVSLGAALGPSVAGDHVACSGQQTTSCGGHVAVTEVASPFWFPTGNAGHDGPADDPHWIHIRSPAGSPDSDYLVTVTANGNVVAGLDIFKVRRDFGPNQFTPGPPTRDRVTPKCPQDLVYDLLPAGGAGAGSPAHLAQLRDIALEQHQTAVPTVGASITARLDRYTEWVVVIDARAGLTTGDELNEVRYTISVTDGVFTGSPVQAPNRPVDIGQWAQNANPCMDDFEAFVTSLLPGAPPLPIPPLPIPPVPPNAAPELGGVLPVEVADLFGSHL